MTAWCTSRKLGRGKRIDKVEDVVKVGDKLRVEIADIDNRGKISLVLVAEDEAQPRHPASRHPSMLMQRPLTRSSEPCASGHRGGDAVAAVRRTALPGGLRVVTEFVPSVRSASVGVWVGVGSRDEGPTRGRRRALPRAPAVQGDPDAHRGARSPRRSTPSAVS